MARKVAQFKSWYYQPRNGALTPAQFQHLKELLKVRFRFWIRFPYRETVFWSRKFKAVRVDFCSADPNPEQTRDRVSEFIWGYFEGLRR